MKVKNFINLLGIVTAITIGNLQASTSKSPATLLEKYTKIVNKVGSDYNPDSLGKIMMKYLQYNLSLGYTNKIGLDNMARQLWVLIGGDNFTANDIIQLAKAQKKCGGGDAYTYNDPKSNLLLFTYDTVNKVILKF